MRILSCILLCALLTSCANFSSEESRKNTQLVRHDSVGITCELVGINGDSLIIEPQDGNAQYFPIHYSLIDHIELRNDASPTLLGAGGLLLGGTVGWLVGGALVEGQYGLGAAFNALSIVAVGAVAGAIIGASGGDDLTIEIQERQDLDKLAKYCRYKTNYQLRLVRGY